ncbi:hypothetical protein D0525_16320 [Salmonella enterica]|uniref:hypothetical protein n=1 Tax=Salmonella enterica TaxID=28901 RepID=UPI001010D952|nr:hypothetical protein [Salmonella enterica]EJH7012885.1 hypothetical protein [Salmonella enterica]EJH7438246.1 hypothetical protein [Salmonella enterica]EJH7877540.1 hypothetical protein [Salmonella enterica]EJI6710254.1 hypothetical protein [Salmonella enterica]RXO38235.1 hypothetical protein D0525_16320 [Salmonella enterica]
MKSLDKTMLRAVAAFCSTFSDKYREDYSSSELKCFVLHMCQKMRPDSAFSGATRTSEQYGELMVSMMRYIACEDNSDSSEHQKLLMANGNMKRMIQLTADRISDQFSEEIESLLANA